ncbi:hypothetical protein HY003_03240 [Candidatus Saccharibacteria bacterium]|nr:hypothetical protein [Candidatus Saccharibacteria bacterium]MBI3338290.1 hypothetical protein [Candidatus Saccharibacteria bacterium]
MTYSNSIAMGRQRFAGKGRNTTSFKNKERTIGPVSNTIALIILACLLGLMYLTQVTKTNSYGYKIDELQTKHDSLKTEHDELEATSARLQAMERVRSSEVAKNLASITPTTTVSN